MKNVNLVCRIPLIGDKNRCQHLEHPQSVQMQLTPSFACKCDPERTKENHSLLCVVQGERAFRRPNENWLPTSCRPLCTNFVWIINFHNPQSKATLSANQPVSQPASQSSPLCLPDLKIISMEMQWTGKQQLDQKRLSVVSQFPAQLLYHQPKHTHAHTHSKGTRQ